MVVTLIIHCVDKEAKDDKGLTALHIVVDKKNVDIVTTLIADSADKDARDIYGLTIFQIANQKGKSDIVAVIEEKGEKRDRI